MERDPLISILRILVALGVAILLVSGTTAILLPGLESDATGVAGSVLIFGLTVVILVVTR